MRSTSSTVRGAAARLSILAVAAGLAVGGAAGAASAATPTWTQPHLPVPHGNLLAVAAVDRHTTWAAGFEDVVSGTTETLHPLLLAHDDRSGGWHRITTPADRTESRINALAGRSASDVWLTGDAGMFDAEGTPVLTEHWDGRAWQVSYAPVPANAETAGLLGVAESAAGDVWAVGWADLIDSETVDPVTGITNVVSHDIGLVEHWDGTAWQQVASPVPALSDAVLNGVATTAAGDVWLTGMAADTDQPIAVHHDAHGWHSTAVPNPGINGELNAVTAAGPDDVWAVGRTVLGDKDSGSPLVEHWDGQRWRQVAAPGTGQLHAAALADGGLVVVGYDDNAPYGERLTAGGWTSLGLPTLGQGESPFGVGVTGGGGLVVTGAYASGTGAMLPLLVTSGA